jgi:hypothetical protein
VHANLVVAVGPMDLDWNPFITFINCKATRQLLITSIHFLAKKMHAQEVPREHALHRESHVKY